MTDPRPITAVIGPTENALRAVLVATLSSTEIRNYAEWVTLTVVQTSPQPRLRADLTAFLADALKTDRAEVDQVLESLGGRGLLEAADISDTVKLSPAGSAEFGSARTTVQQITQRLVSGLDPVDELATRRVLDQIRTRAESELAGLTTIQTPGHGVAGQHLD